MAYYVDGGAIGIEKGLEQWAEDNQSSLLDLERPIPFNSKGAVFHASFDNGRIVLTFSLDGKESFIKMVTIDEFLMIVDVKKLME